MKIFLQDREKIVDMPREIWMSENRGQYSIIGTAYITPILGIYETEKKAKEVLNAIFEHYQDNERCYVMPLE